MASRPKCHDPEAQETIHKGYDKTSVIKPPSHPGGKPWEVWRCQCGNKTLDVVAGTKRSW